ncbi:glycosyltransferase family 2 protein [Lichenicoccus sp.]|uniref:glycosyltransferase family 2 protein n=1 Tax=Lichenicoccus sp. TaxID=2781899 RepID=UPI003D0E0DE6
MADSAGTSEIDQGGFSGYFDRYETGRASGWVANLADPQSIVVLTALIDGEAVDQILCDGLREDVREALNLVSARVGFRYDIPGRYLENTPHVLSFRLPDGGVLSYMGVGGVGSLSPSLEFAGLPHVALHGNLDGMVHNTLRGWVLRQIGHAGAMVAGGDVLITCDDVRIGLAHADRLRRDVGSANASDPYCGFEFALPQDLRSSQPRRYRAFALPEMRELAGSPLVTATVTDLLEGRLLALSAGMQRLQAELCRMGRELDLLLPSEGYHIEDFDRWARRYYETLRQRVTAGRRIAEAQGASDTPASLAASLVSVLMPTYKPHLPDFVAAVESVLAQTHGNWELIIVDDGSRSAEVTTCIDAFCARDRRIRSIRRSRNAGIARATSLAMQAARGAWTAFFDHDDLLVEVALEVMLREARRTGALLLYSDEDKIDRGGYFREPNFKPDWNYRYLLGCNYVCHLTMVDSATMRAVGPLRREYDGAQDHDFILRCAELLEPGRIHHVPELLYHWRITPNSTADSVSNKQYAVEAGVRCVADHLARTGHPAQVSAIDRLSIYKVDWMARPASPEIAVSVIIPFRDQIGITRAGVASLLRHTDYASYEIVLVDNWSTAPDLPGFLAEMRREPRVRVLRVEEAFNYSRLNNLAAASSDAGCFVFLNNDVVIGDPQWLHRMLGEITAAADIGIVGAKLLYPDRTVQHAGVLVGLHGVAAHPHLGASVDEYGYSGRARLSQELMAVTGACMMVRAALFHEIGGFDEVGLKVAYNDVDLCLRAHERGWRVVWCAEVAAEHLESLSRGSDLRPDQEARFLRERQVMLERWGAQAFFRNDPFYNPNLSSSARLFYTLADPAGRAPI